MTGSLHITLFHVMWSQTVQVHVPARIVALLDGLGDCTEGGNERLNVHISPSVFVKASTTSSVFHRCLKAYMSTKPSDGDLKSLFEIGHFDIRTKNGPRLTAEIILHRSHFVKEVVRRGEPAVDSFEPDRDCDVQVCQVCSSFVVIRSFVRLFVRSISNFLIRWFVRFLIVCALSMWFDSSCMHLCTYVCMYVCMYVFFDMLTCLFFVSIHVKVLMKQFVQDPTQQSLYTAITARLQKVGWVSFPHISFHFLMFHISWKESGKANCLKQKKLVRTKVELLKQLKSKFYPVSCSC